MTDEKVGTQFAVNDVRTFVPAENFERSKAFYQSLGWTTAWTDNDGLALMELGGYRFSMDMISSRTFDSRTQQLEYAPRVLDGPPNPTTKDA